MQKINPDSIFERYKTRLVMKGFYATIRSLLALAPQIKLIVYQVESVTALLKGDVDGEEVYMEQPGRSAD